MAALELYADTYRGLAYDLQTAIDAYTQALAAFATTEGEPAPSAPSLVETIVKQHEGKFVIVMPPAPADPQPLPKDPAYYRSPAEQAEIIAAEQAELEPPKAAKGRRR